MTEKSSKAAANYRQGSPDKHCSICTMFRAPHGCTAVKGTIEPDDVCDFFKRKVSTVEQLSALMSINARSLDIPTDSHPNKMPFSGVLTRIDEPSDAAPDGSNGKRVMITAEAAERALDTLLGMAVDYTPDMDGHDPKAKIGVITAADIEGNAINVKGFIYAADFPEVAAEIKANKHVLGMSFEARDLYTSDRDANPVPIVDCTFTGAAILLKDKAAYTTTSINARKGDPISDKETLMSQEVKAQLDAIAASVAELAKSVAAQADTITKLNEEKVAAANHLAKVERHAAELEKAADHMDAAGIGGDPDRGHTRFLRDMAGDIRAQAAQGRIPASFYSFRAAAEQKVEAAKVDVDGAVKAAAEKVAADFTKQIAELKAAAEKSETALKDQLASAETKLKDVELKAQAEVPAPTRSTYTPGQSAALMKAGVELPTDGGKLELGKLDKMFAQAGLSTDQKIELKTVLARNGVID